MKLNDFNENAWQGLRQAIREGNLNSVARLLSTSPELLRMTEPNPCLHLAAREGRLNIVQFLITLGANINLEVDLFGTPLDEAASEGHLELVKYLVKQGASLATPRPDRNPLFSAIDGGHIDIVRFLLEAGIDPHVVYRGESGRLKNALSYAQEEDQTDIAELLVNAGCRVPIEGVDKPVWEPEEASQPTAHDSARDQIIARMTEVFGPVDPLTLLETVPVHEEVHVAINVIRPNERHRFLTFFSTGMSDRPMAVPEGQEAYQYTELVMHFPATWPTGPSAGMTEDYLWPLQVLRMVAYYPHLTDSWIGGPHTIITPTDPPVPLGPNTKQTCLLLIADFSDWSPMVLDDGRIVRFYTVIPLYTAEREFEKQHGIVPLLQRLQERGYTAVASINRPSVVPE